MPPRVRVSLTARNVAQVRSRIERPEVPTGDAEAEDRLTRSMRPVLPTQLPGLRAYIEARTRFFDRALLRACGTGVQQVVVVGAGYDGRALRYRQPGVTFFELDHPVTQEDKRRRLAELGVEAGDVRFVPIDFGHQAPADVLAGAGHDPDRPTHFMCEGVTPYIPLDALHATFTSLRSCAGAGSTFAVDWAEERPRADVLRRAVLGVVRLGTVLVGERIVTTVTTEEAGDVLRAAGWTDVATERAGGYPALLSLARP